MWLRGIYDKLGIFGGSVWGNTLVCLGVVLLLRIISVANMCKRSRGPLVRFVYKRQLRGKFKIFYQDINIMKPG